MDRVEIVHKNFLHRVQQQDFPNAIAQHGSPLEASHLHQIFYAQTLSRHIDRIARQLKAQGEGFYTIASSGHEGSAAIAAALNVDDPAFLHYRDGAFQIMRAMKLPGQNPLWDMLLSLTSSAEDPISGGRHKVLGSKTLHTPPQTSTIASHLPKALGAAYAIGLTKKITPEHQEFSENSIVYCSFGDASLNHSTAQGAINTAGWTVFQHAPLPLLFVCQDNGIGISVKSPQGWVTASLSQRPGLKYFTCNGLDATETYHVAKAAANWIRTRKKPAILHMQCVRLYGHAGADMPQTYLSRSEIEKDEANDPLLHTARQLIETGACSADDILTIYNNTANRVERAAQHVISRPKLTTADEVMAAIIPPKRQCINLDSPTENRRETLLGPEYKKLSTPMHMAKAINLALHDLMLTHNNIILAGEDVGRKGGVYGVTKKLHERFGPARVIDSLLDEQAILGLAIGLGQNGFIPIPEIQFLAYLHNAEDQIRGEAATLPFFSNGQYSNPMVIRIAGLAYQKGFGGHFHNDNSIAVLRDIPGIIIACPSNARDAVLMLREAVRLAREEQRVVVFLEPIALYMTRDLHMEKDQAWAQAYPSLDTPNIKMDEIHIEGDGEDIAIVTYGNGYYLSRQAQTILSQNHNINARVIDMRWLAPVPKQALLEALKHYKHILIVDECRETGSQSEALSSFFHEQLTKAHIERLTAMDSFIATGPAYAAPLPSCNAIIERVLNILSREQKRPDHA